jgi:enoyl-CoA hydratase
MMAGYGRTAVFAAREAIERAQESSLREGLLFERRTYYALWATQDAQEGMRAFMEKREPAFVGR